MNHIIILAGYSNSAINVSVLSTSTEKIVLSNIIRQWGNTRLVDDKQEVEEQQETHGPHRSPEKHFLAIDINKNHPLEKGVILHLNKFKFPPHNDVL